MARLGLVSVLLGQVAVLLVLSATTGLGVASWAVGLGWAAAVAAMVARGVGLRWTPAEPRRAATTADAPALPSTLRPMLGPANRVTLLRAVLVGAVAALVVEGLMHEEHQAAIASLAAIALVLDAADGWVARRTGTASSLGARFDMEVDAFLILVLSVAVAATTGAWVLLIGLARYLLLAATRAAPWLGAPVPPRMWRKAVAALQGIVLTAVVSGLLPEPAARTLLLVAAAALAASFGEQIHWLQMNRRLMGQATTSARAARAVPTRAS